MTLTPFTALETNGKARVEHTPNGEIVYFPLKVLLRAGSERRWAACRR